MIELIIASFYLEEGIRKQARPVEYPEWAKLAFFPTQ